MLPQSVLLPLLTFELLDSTSSVGMRCMHTSGHRHQHITRKLDHPTGEGSCREGRSRGAGAACREGVQEA